MNNQLIVAGLGLRQLDDPQVPKAVLRVVGKATS